MADMRVPGRHRVRGRAAMHRLGQALGALLRAGNAVLLQGPLGAGKTTLVQGIALGLGCTEPVTSPTFDLIHEYRSGRSPLIHIDPYRLSGAAEVEQIGFCEYLDLPCVLAVEWPDRLGALAPASAVRVDIQPEGRIRIVTIDVPDDLAGARAQP